MGSVIIIAVIVVCAGWIGWRRHYRRSLASAIAASEGIPRENPALKAFAHGNTCLSEGKLDEAAAAFREAQELDPTHPHIAGRLAEVQRRQQVAGAAGGDTSTG